MPFLAVQVTAHREQGTMAAGRKWHPRSGPCVCWAKARVSRLPGRHARRPPRNSPARRGRRVCDLESSESLLGRHEKNDNPKKLHREEYSFP